MLENTIRASPGILELGTGLLRFCRDNLSSLCRACESSENWVALDQLREEAVKFFRRVDDDELNAAEVDNLADLALSAMNRIPEVLCARGIAQALDDALGFRFLPLFEGRTVLVQQGDPVPVPRVNWPEYMPNPSSDPWNLNGQLDALRSLRIARDWEPLKVEICGSQSVWRSIPQLVPGDRLGLAVLNSNLTEFTWQRRERGGRRTFFNVRPGNVDLQKQRSIDLLEKAQEVGCRVVVFPELSMTDEIADEVERWTLSQEKVELVVTGSRHTCRDGLRSNVATMLLLHSRQIIEHRKFKRFSFKDPRDGQELLEDLEMADPPYQLKILLSQRWSVTFLICKDLVNQPMPQVLTDLGVNLVLVPSMTPKTRAFEAAASGLAAGSQAITLVANSCLELASGERPPAVIGVPSEVRPVILQQPRGPALVCLELGTSTSEPTTFVVS